MATSDVVVFDVGGQRFSTTLKTLNRYPDSLLPVMCQECHNAVGTGKEIHIDRTPEGFGWILEIYRGDGKQSLPTNWSLDGIQKELDFYQLPPATEFIPFHADMMVIIEKDALKKLPEEMCEKMKRVQQEIFLAHSAKFLVWADTTNRSTLHCEYVNLCINSIEDNLNDFIRSFWRPGHLALKKEHLAILSKQMLALGFKVSLELYECKVDPHRSTIFILDTHGVNVSTSILEVTWDF
ncbi:hypothetical protein BSKO_05127 [Bryopsis sp. KO-2023]|nr:hypothetical protein BSKO_05127 [Bryopsis sp. KO-2023]